MARRLLPLLLFGITLTVYIAILPPTILPGDSGELIAASRTMSIAHPPGYPLYIMLGKIFSSAVNFGSIAYRYNLLSAIIASLTVTLFYFLTTSLGVDKLVGFGISMVLCATDLFWLQAISAEVYPLTAFFTVLLLFVGILAKRLGRGSFLLLAYLGGLAISHHLTLVYVVISAAVLIVIRARVVPSWRTVIIGALLFLMGLSIWLYIPIRADLNPPLTWGETDEFKGFVSHILGNRYKCRLKTFEVLERVIDFARFARVAVRSAGLPFTLLAVLGIIGYAKRVRSIAAYLCLIFLFAFHFAIYKIPDIEVHIFPFLIGVAILAALGAGTLVKWLSRFRKQAGIAVPVAVLLLAGYKVMSISPRQDVWFAHDYNVAVEESAIAAVGDHPVLITKGDFAALSFYYRALVEKQDLTLFVVGASDPSVLGRDEALKSPMEAARAAEEKFGPGRVVTLTRTDIEMLSLDGRMCGMVWAPGPGDAPYPAPMDYEIRGVGAEPHDYFSKALSAEYYVNLAYWYSGQGDTALAEHYLDRAMEATVGDPETLIEASRLHTFAGQHTKAVDLLQKAVEAQPTHFYARFALANVLSMVGRDDEALHHYQKGIRGSPDPAPAYVNMGTIYLSRGDTERAAEHFSMALDRDTSNVLANLGMASTLRAKSDTRRALVHIDRAIASNPKYAPSYHARASVLMGAGESEEAYKTIKEGLAIVPGEGVLLSDLGLYYLRADMPDSASKHFERALDISPSMLAARGNLAYSYELMGLDSKAAEQYRIYIANTPAGRSRQMAIDALRRIEAGTDPTD